MWAGQQCARRVVRALAAARAPAPGLAPVRALAGTGSEAALERSPDSRTLRETRPSVLVVGMGRMGMIRAQNALASQCVELGGIVDDNVELLHALGTVFPGVGTFGSLEEALKGSGRRFDAVWLALPSPVHEAAIRYVAGEHGLPVAVEKPVALDEEGIHRCYDAAEAAGVALMCSFQRRLDPNYVAMYEAVKGGRLGSLRSVHAVFRDYPVPPIDFLAKGGCIFNDLLVHDIDFVRSLLDDDVVLESVYATGSSFDEALIEIGVYEQAHVALQFSSGAVFTAELSRSSPYGYDQRIEVCGSRGAMQIDNVPTTSMCLMTHDGISRDTPLHSFPERFAAAFQCEMDYLADVVVGAVEPLVSREDSILATRFANAARESAATGEVVHMTAE